MKTRVRAVAKVEASHRLKAGAYNYLSIFRGMQMPVLVDIWPRQPVHVWLLSSQSQHILLYLI